MQTPPLRHIRLFQANETSVVMRGIIMAILLGALALASPLVVSRAFAQGGAVVKVDPASTTVNVGATVVVNIRIENVANLAGAEVHFTYDPFLLEAQSIQAGGFPAPDFVVQSSATGGKIDYAIAQMPPHTPVSGSGVLLQVTFKGLAAGTSVLHVLSAVLSDGSGTLIPSTTQDGTVIVGGPTSTPTNTPTNTPTATPTNTPTPTQTGPTNTPTPTATPTNTPVPGSAVVKVSPALPSAAVDSLAAVAVRIENAANLWGVDLKLTYDPAIVQCTQSQVGTIPAPRVVAKNTCDGGAAEYIVTQQSPDAPASGSGDAVRLTFKCLKVGASSLHFDRATLVNNDGQPLSKSTTDGRITCEPPPGGGSLPGRHTVRAGESLYCIGRAYVVSPWAIAQVNGIAWPYTIFVGQVLQIPNAPWINPPFGPVCQRQFGTPSPTATPGPTPTPGPAACRVRYTVVRGDTLYSIAVRYNSTVWAIGQANGILNLNLIYPGQVLCIP